MGLVNSYFHFTYYADTADDETNKKSPGKGIYPYYSAYNLFILQK